MAPTRTSSAASRRRTAAPPRRPPSAEPGHEAAEEFLGLVRWPFLVPYLARAAADAADRQLDGARRRGAHPDERGAGVGGRAGPRRRAAPHGLLARVRRAPRAGR